MVDLHGAPYMILNENSKRSAKEINSIFGEKCKGH
jgi:hypothetical protein